MKLCKQGSTLLVSEIEQLNAEASAVLQSELVSALNSTIRTVEMDFSSTRYADCCGIGALISMRALAQVRTPNIQFHISHPSSKLERLLQLTNNSDFLESSRQARLIVSTPSQAQAAQYQPHAGSDRDQNRSTGILPLSIRSEQIEVKLLPGARTVDDQSV